MFSEYLAHGWKLCRIEPGSKGPRYRGWNEEHNALLTAKGVEAAGLMHAYSGTCAFDIDDLERAAVYLQKHGIDVSELFMAPDAVQISSGRPNRGKLLYAMSKPLPSKSFAEGAFELRCGTNGDKSAQDVLPPSPHPMGGRYRWIGDWRVLPPIPEVLLTLWTASGETPRDESQKQPSSPPTAGNRLTEAKELLAKKDPDCGYDEWIHLGMALHHESEGNDVGFEIWDNWSSAGVKYPGINNLHSHWASFGRSETPITLDSFLRVDVAAIEDFDYIAVQKSEANSSEKDVLTSTFPFLTFPEMANLPEPDWIIPGILPDKGIGCIWGKWSSGKTFLAVDIAVTVALGTTWRGFPAKQGGVLYIAAEDAYGIRLRGRTSFAAHGLSDAPIRVLNEAPVFTDPKQTKALLQSIQRYGPQALTFVDTLATVIPGSDENSTKDIGLALRLCQQIQKLTGGLVILIHHPGKDESRGPRGSSSLSAAFDVEWHITTEDNVEVRQMQVSKLKNAPAGAVYPFRLAVTGESCVVEWI